MAESQELRAILEKELKNLEEKEKRAKELEIEAQNIKAEVEAKRQKLLLALGLNSVEKKIQEKGINADIEQEPKLWDKVLSCVEKLSRDGPFTYYDVINSLKKLPAGQRVRMTLRTKKRVRAMLAYLVTQKKLVSERQPTKNYYTYSRPAPKGKEIRRRCLKNPKTLIMHILRAINELDEVGSETTANAIWHQLVSAHGRTYDDLGRKKVAGSVYYLLNGLKLIYVSKKTGRRNCYKINDEGKKVLKTLEAAPAKIETKE
jgi:hypothetical protein